jgi:hypothetical protein
MRIRAEQMEVFQEAARRTFEEEMVFHLGGFSPPLFQVLTANGMRQVVSTGILRATNLTLTLRGPIRLYLEMMLLFGSNFDSDPQYPWVPEILEDRHLPEMMRADRLYQKTCEYRQKVAGPANANTLAALKRLSAKATQPAARFVSEMAAAMAEIYPEKATYVGETPMCALIEEGVATGRRYGFSTVRSLGLSAVLMFAFGHGCFEDPLYPWIGRTADGNGNSNPEARAQRLEKKALTWLHHVLGYFERGENL